ncbi:nephrin-like [Cherax quadricarinatus]|uniref:nephrin-like n=1 Tax=Cherax quadricarinatus TaxID=27406 RepID=UPI00387E2F63
MNHALVGVGVGVRQVRTEVNIPALTRDYIHANLTCRATNNNITEPLSTTMALLLYLRPTSVSISEPASPLVEGQEARLECVALGAYPAADLSWSLTPTHATSPITLPSASRHLGQKTSSLARVTPTADDHLATLTCSAHNPNITGRPITTSILLHVVFAPRVRLQLGATLGSAPITEGKDVYFECEVVANPPVREIVWRKDVSIREGRDRGRERRRDGGRQRRRDGGRWMEEGRERERERDKRAAITTKYKAWRRYKRHLNIYNKNLPRQVFQRMNEVQKWAVSVWETDTKLASRRVGSKTWWSLVRGRQGYSPDEIILPHNRQDGAVCTRNGSSCGPQMAAVAHGSSSNRWLWPIDGSTAVCPQMAPAVTDGSAVAQMAPAVAHNGSSCALSCGPQMAPAVAHRWLQLWPTDGSSLSSVMLNVRSFIQPERFSHQAMSDVDKVDIAFKHHHQPVCVSVPQTVAVAEGEKIRLTCRVDAQPNQHLSFTWFFNNTLDTIEVDSHRVTVLPGLSMLDYTPMSPRDYGTLSCWATNEVGTQADPCRFTVIEAGPPERVGNCVLVNLTVASLEVGCTAGNDGGLPQRFIARVYAAPTHTLLATLEEEHTPRFHVGGLTPGQDYLITVTAVNAKGTSLPQQIDAVRLKVCQCHGVS